MSSGFLIRFQEVTNSKIPSKIPIKWLFGHDWADTGVWSKAMENKNTETAISTFLGIRSVWNVGHTSSFWHQNVMERSNKSNVFTTITGFAYVSVANLHDWFASSLTLVNFQAQIGEGRENQRIQYRWIYGNLLWGTVHWRSDIFHHATFWYE